MIVNLFVLVAAVLAMLTSLGLFSGALSAIHQILASVMLLIASVLFCTAALLTQLRKMEKRKV